MSSDVSPAPWPSQIRAARALLGWSEAKLAQMSKLSVAAVKRLEREDQVEATVGLRSAAGRALELAGVVFLDAATVREGGLGLRLKR